MKKYKLSKYNVFRQFDDDTYIACNLVEKIFFGLDSKKYYLLINNSTNLEKVREINSHLFSAMQKLGIIVDGDINETNKIILSHREQVYNNNTYRMTIMPTLDCNFNCWYCYEEHPKGKMSILIQKAIIKLVTNILDENNPRLFSLDWFGGEPLLYFNDLVYPISLKIKRECEKRNILFANGITTNGALIVKEMCKKLNKIKMESYQITLDGAETFHNQVKKSQTQFSEYQNILNIIQYLCDAINNLKLLVRINYTPKNIDSLDKIIDDIPQNIRDKITITFQQVWQTQNESLNQKIKSVIEKFILAGFKVDKPNICNAFHKCYADVKNQVVISPNGNVFKCTARDFINEVPDGILNANGTIEWNSSYYNRLCKTTIEYERCIDCNLLPACWGPCSQKLMEYQVGEFDKICNYSGVETTITTMMNDFYITQILCKNDEN